jgi:hypothetical protein
MSALDEISIKSIQMLQGPLFQRTLQILKSTIVSYVMFVLTERFAL